MSIFKNKDDKYAILKEMYEISQKDVISLKERIATVEGLHKDSTELNIRQQELIEVKDEEKNRIATGAQQDAGRIVGLMNVLKV